MVEFILALGSILIVWFAQCIVSKEGGVVFDDVLSGDRCTSVISGWLHTGVGH